jgi:hypothetical protein
MVVFNRLCAVQEEFHCRKGIVFHDEKFGSEKSALRPNFVQSPRGIRKVTCIATANCTNNIYYHFIKTLHKVFITLLQPPVRMSPIKSVNRTTGAISGISYLQADQFSPGLSKLTPPQNSSQTTTNLTNLP